MTLVGRVVWAGSLAALTWGAAAAEYLTVVSWGGSYARACEKGYHEDFTAETGIQIRLENYNGDIAQLRAQVGAGAVHWDVVDMTIADAATGCAEGILEVIDFDLPPGANGEPPEDDFYPETTGECGLSTLFYSTVYAYYKGHFKGRQPETIADFFDLETFPGRRGMRRTPTANLEFALMADGVPRDEVYAILDTPEGISRAFRKLDTIKDQVIWWKAGAQPPQMLADGEVAMTTAYNGRIFNAQVLEDQPFIIVWDGQVLDSSQLGIAAGAPNLEAARKFLAFAARPSSMAGVGRYIAYAPTRRSGMDLISVHAETGEEMAPHMPIANVERALYSDWRWWSDNMEEMNERFSDWLMR